MLEILISLIPGVLLVIALILILDLYLLVRKYLKLKIEELKKNK